MPMPQQLPALRQEQQAQSTALRADTLLSSSTTRDSIVSFGKETRADVSTASIASARRALRSPHAGFATMTPSSRHWPHREGSRSGAELSQKATPASKALVPAVKACGAAKAALSVPFSAPLRRNNIATTVAAPSSHLENVGLGPSLARDSYLAHEPGSHGHHGAGAGVAALTLQDATTGLLVRHIRLDSVPDAVQDDTDGNDSSTAAPRGGDCDAPTLIAPSTLVDAAPVKSAALLDAGVDDRINPFVLHQLIQRSHRRARSTATAAAEQRSFNRKGQLEDEVRKSRLLKTTAAGLRLGSGTKDTAMDSAATELHYHEPPAIMEASQACYTEAPGNGDTGSVTTLTAAPESKTDSPAATGPKQMLDLIAEYNRNLEVEKEPQAFAPGMSSSEYAHLAAAVSSNDSALVRQLVGYYCARSKANSPARTATQAAVVQAPTRANMQSRTTFKDKTAKAAPGASTGDGGGDSVASPPDPFSSTTPNFSLLDAVMCVSREFVAQRSAAGIPGQSASALSDRRRCLLERLTSLDQTRIPETWWVTSLQCPGRLTTAAGSGCSAATASAAASEKKQPASSAAVSMLAVPMTDSRLSAPSGTSWNGTGRSSGSVSPPSMEQPPGLASEIRMGARNGTPKAPVIQVSPVSSGALCGSEGQLVFGTASSHKTIFPAPRPVERSQVYLLAEVLDRMLRDPSHPQWLALLADPQVARYVLGDKDDVTSSDGQRRGGGHDTLEVDLWGTPGEQRLFAYTDAATHVLEILDTGLAELVRQVASHCLERGVLLDLLRQSTMDIASAHVHVLKQVKQQAHADALAAQRLRKEKAQLEQELEAVQKALAELQSTHDQLCSRVEPLQRKSDRLDELMARVAAKARRFETFRHDEHAALLQVLEESMTQSAGAALDSFFKEMHDLEARHSGLEETATRKFNDSTGEEVGYSHGDGAVLPNVSAADIPSVSAARSQALEQQQTMVQLYTESHRLLSGLQGMVTATNAVCGRLYDKIILKDVSPAAKVATSRWASVARAVGAFEKDKRHRQRVFEVFMEYCTSYRHTRGANAGLPAGREGSASSSKMSYGSQHTHSSEEALLVDDKKETNASHSNNGNEDPPLAHSKPSALMSCAEASIPEDSWQRCSSATKSKEGIDVDRAASAVGGVREKMQQEVVMSSVIITREDLAAMKATDCSVEEVNDLFRKDFDIHKYLRGSWPQYALERQQQEQHGAVAVTTSASGSGGKQTTVESTYMLRLPDVLQMLRDVQATLAEVTVRMNAIAKSAVLEAGLHPPLEPPSHPEQPCPLCSRRDTCELERHRRREAMSRIARDLQKKMEAVEAKSRAALTERDEALGEVRRLKMELQHSATVTSARRPAVIGAAQQQQQQDMHSGPQGHRHQRQTSADTTTEAPSPRHRTAWNFEGETNSPNNSSNDTTMVIARSVNSLDTSAVFSQPNKPTSPFGVSGATVGASMSLPQSSVNLLGDAHVAGSFSTVSYEEVDYADMPSRRRYTVMMPKSGDSADHDGAPPSLSVTDVITSPLEEAPFNALASDLAGSHADGGGVTRGIKQGEEARQQRRQSPSDGASDNANAAEMPKGGHL